MGGYANALMLVSRFPWPGYRAVGGFARRRVAAGLSWLSLTSYLSADWLEVKAREIR